MSISMLGSFQVSVANRPVEPQAWRLRKATHLVKILALTPGHRLHRDQLIDALWPEIDPDSALTSFHQALHAARHALEPERSARASGSLLRLHQQILSFEPADDVWIDAEAFQTAVARARASQDLDAHLAAQALYAGDLLPEDLYESWTQRARDSLREMDLELLLATARLQEERGLPADASETLRRLIDSDPLNEAAHAALMLLYARSGRRDQALRIYQQLSERLRTELDAEPAPDVSQLHQRISSGEPLENRVVPQPPAQATPLVPAQSDLAGGSRISLAEFAREDGIFNRGAQLDLLQQSFDAFRAGRGQIVLLAGEPGIGKTRLAEALSHFAGLNGATVLWARCHEAEGAPAFWPWLQIVRSSLRAGSTELLTTDLGVGAGPIAQVVPEIHALLPETPMLPKLDPDQARFRFFESVTNFLVRLSERHPLVVILDDLQWADRSSLMLLDFLGDEVAAHRIMLVGTYRDADAAGNVALIRTLERLNRSRATHRLMLTGLEIQDTAQYGAFIAGRPLPENLVATIYERTNGNPFFLREVVQLLADEGHVDDPSDLDRWGTVVPLGVREAVTLRLSRLSDEARRVLVDAAVIGSEFALELLSAVSALSVDRLLDLLEDAVALGVIAEDSTHPNRFRFTHILVRQTLYESLIVARRTRIHARIGDALEQISASSADPPYAELAHHFSLAAAAGDADRALKYLTAAGEQSMARLAYAEAVDQFRHALEILDRFMPERHETQFDVLLMLAGAELAAGESSEAHASRLRSVELARRLGDPERLALAALQMVDIASDYLDWRAHDEAVLLEEVLETLPAGDDQLRVQVMSRLAHVLLFDKTTPESHELAAQRERLVQEAVSMAKRIGTPELIADALRAAHDVLWTYEDVDDRIDIARELLALSIETANPRLELAARAQLAGEFLIKGLVDEADQELDAYETIATNYQLPVNIWSVTAKRAMRAFMRGELRESDALMERAHAIGRRSAPSVSRLSYLLQLFITRREQDRLIEVEAMLTAEAVNHPGEALWHCLLAVLYADTDRHEDASKIVAELLDQPDSAIPRDSFWLASLVLIADACVTLRDTSHAAILLTLLRPHASRFVSPGNHVIFLGPVSHYLGCLATCLEQWDDAATYFDQALAAAWTAATPVFEGYTELAYARMLARHGGNDDRATQFIDAALQISSRSGLARLGSLSRMRRARLLNCHSP